MERLFEKKNKQEMARNKCLTLNLITSNTKRDREKRKRGENIYFFKQKN